MPFNGVLLASAANKSAEVWQRAACLPERISSDDMVDLVICFPLQQLGRWALYVWTYLCVLPYPHRHHYATYYGDDSNDDSDDGGGGGGASSSVNNDYHYVNNDYHYCSYCNRNSVGYDASSNSD